jgi:3-deoxy-D-manno-octulosonate 8-phosphate phosphatase (KDO 8-P phosphatase)
MSRSRRGVGIAERLSRIRVVLFDVDGVLTDGRIVFLSGGDEAKFFDAKDGHRIKMARRAGLKVYFVTGRRSEAVARRAAELGVDGVWQGILEKAAVLKEIVAGSGAQPEEMAYMGDDLPDLPIMSRVGVSACPSDAAAEVLERAALVVDHRGGRGAAAALIEEILKAQGKWEEQIRRYLKDHEK